MEQAKLLLEGKYEILAKIREGGMGTIYQVRHRLLDEIRVVKVMRSSTATEPEMKRRFVEEARTAIRLKHPNICSIYDFAADDSGTAYLVMEYIDGISLAELLKASGPPPIALSLQVAHQALLALGYLHRRGVIHRDVSPDNLMLTYDDEHQPVVKVIDLGIAKIVDRELDLTATGVFLGKPRYASPEQFGLLPHGERLDGRSDLYGLGIVLYELLTGIRPYVGKSPLEFIRAQHLHLLVPFEESDPTGRVAPPLRAMVLKALEKRREDRFPNAEDFDRELMRILDQSTGWAQRGVIPSIVSVAREAQPQVSDSPTPGAQDRLNQHFGSHSTPSPSAPLLTLVPPDPPADELHTVRITLAGASESAAPSRPTATNVPFLEQTAVGPQSLFAFLPLALPDLPAPTQAPPVATPTSEPTIVPSTPTEVASRRDSIHLQEIVRRNPRLLPIIVGAAAVLLLLLWRPWSRPDVSKSVASPLPAPAATRPAAVPAPASLPTVEVAPPPARVDSGTIADTSPNDITTGSAPAPEAAGEPLDNARQLASSARKQADEVRGSDFAPNVYRRAVGKETAAANLATQGAVSDAMAAFSEASILFDQAAAIGREHLALAPTTATTSKRTAPLPAPAALAARSVDLSDPVAAADARKKITQVIGDYAWALRTRNAKLYAQVYPTDIARFRQLLGRFDQLDVRMDVQSIDFQGARAVASVKETMIGRPREGNEVHTDTDIKLELAKQGGRWVLVKRA